MYATTLSLVLIQSCWIVGSAFETLIRFITSDAMLLRCTIGVVAPDDVLVEYG
jgi:hypothetical protein